MTGDALIRPPGGRGPGVLVIPEFWGLNDQVIGVAEKLGKGGFVALAVDLYQGPVTSDRSEAFRLSASLSLDQAAAALDDCVDRLLADEAVVGTGLGVVGYCLGGGMALYAASRRPEILACVPFYGLLPTADHPVTPDWTAMKAAVLGHIAEHDTYASPADAEALSVSLDAAGVENHFEVYAGCQHAFANETQPERYDAAADELSWQRTVEFLMHRLTSDPPTATPTAVP